MTDLLLAVHVIGAFAFAGGLAISLATLSLTDRNSGTLPRLQAVANPFMNVGALLLLATGIWMAFRLGVVLQSWLVVALVLFFGLGAPQRMLVEPRLAGHGSPTAAAVGVGVIVAAVFSIAVLMVLKPGGPTPVVVAAGLLAAGAIVALAAAQLRVRAVQGSKREAPNRET